MFFIFLLPKLVTATMVSDTCFEFTPKGDLFVKKGEEMLFRCSIKVRGNCFHDYNISNIVIKKGSIPVSPNFIINHEAEKAVETNIPYASFGDAGNYTCENRTRTTNGTRSAVKTVHVGEPPSVPEKLRCLSRQFDDMICWFLMNKTDYNIHTRWEMEFKLFSQNWTTIPESNCNCSNHTCWLNSRTKAPSSITFMPSASYQVRVVVWNRLGNATAKITIADTDSIVQPGPVERLSYNYTTTSKNVNLQWTTPQKYIRWIDYKILISSEFDNRTLLVWNRTAAREEYFLEDLIPFLTYSVSVCARPSSAELDIYWSTATTVKFRTKTAIPLHAVTMTAGSYVILDCGQRDMCIVIYWKNPEKKYRNGLITGYNVTIRMYCFEQTTSMVKNEPSCNHQGDLESSSEVINGMAVYGTLQTKMLKDDNYLVEVMVKNSKGVSRNHSELIIPNWNTGQARKPIWVVAELTNKSAFISWQMYPKFCSAVTSVTYYWCSEDVDDPLNSVYVSCKDGFNWKELEITDGCGARNGHNILRSVDSPGLRYAVSVETETVSGSLKWENFRFQKNNVPEKPLYRVSADDTVLKVHIQYRDYHQSKGGKPDSYTIMYEGCVSARDCASDVSSRTHITFPVDFVNQDYIADNLEPGSLYKVQVVASNDAGSSIRGKAVMVTIPEDLKVKVVEIVSGTLTGALCLALALLWYRKTRQNMAITVPDQDETILKMQVCYRSEKETQSSAADDHDSGRLSSSLEGFSEGSVNNQESTTSTDLSSNLQNVANTADTQDATAFLLEHGNELSSKNLPTCKPVENTHISHDNDEKNKQLMTLQTSFYPGYVDANRAIVVPHTNCTVDSVHAIAVPHTNSTVDAVHSIAVPHTNSTFDAAHDISFPHADSAVDAVYDITVSNVNNTVDSVYETDVSKPNSTVDANRVIDVPHANSAVDAVDTVVSHANSAVDAVHDITVSYSNSTGDAVHDITVSYSNSTGDAVHDITVSHSNSTVDAVHDITVSYSNSTVDCFKMKKLAVNHVGIEKENCLFLNSSSVEEVDYTTHIINDNSYVVTGNPWSKE